MSDFYRKYRYKDRDIEKHKKKGNLSTGKDIMRIKKGLKNLLDKDDMKGLIKKAKEVADKTPAKTNQMDRIYSSIVKIQEKLDDTDEEAKKRKNWKRELFTLKPRVIYASARENNLKPLRNHILAFIELIEGELAAEKKTRSFCHFMEAFFTHYKEKEL